jgi:hypothetical protein
LHGFNPLNSGLIAFNAAPLHINLDVSSGDLLEIKPEPEKDGAEANPTIHTQIRFLGRTSAF